MSSKPIGIFDSGVGGLSIWNEIHQLLPMESTIYLSDSKHAPYGPKGQEVITNLSIKNTEWLINQGCKLIVVACNTATTNAIETLRKNYPIPFIGIEPAIKPAALFSKTGAIGILATKGTLTSKLFEKTANEYTKTIITIKQDGEGLVPLIEAGKLNSVEVKKLLEKYLKPMLQFDIDHLVLGCTHYPLMAEAFQEALGPDTRVLSQANLVAESLADYLGRRPEMIGKGTEAAFLTTGDPKKVSSRATQFLRREITFTAA